MEMSKAKIHSKLFTDNDKAIKKISKDLRELSLYQFSWNDVNRSSVSVSCDVKDCAVIVVVWEHAARQGNITTILETQGWLLQSQQKITWCEKCGWFEEKGGKSQEILS